MWSAFETWCMQQQVDPAAVDANEIMKYLRSRESLVPSGELAPRYAWRLVTLIDRVVNHKATVQGRAPNRAAAVLMERHPELKFANATHHDQLPDFLSDSQDRSLVSYLQDVARIEQDTDSKTTLRQWQSLRNRTGVALQLGAGLTPLEIRLLKVSSVLSDSQGPWKVRAPASARVRVHETPLAQWAKPIVATWLRVRCDLGIPGDWLLPSTKSGKPWGKTTHFDSVAAVLEDAGLTGYKGGSYLLRHTFALKQLSKPENTEAGVADWLGVDVEEMKRYRGLIMKPVDVV
jgi:integrase